jgi:tripartite-type tricarboxylate transporter receptor subunit TctC
MCIVGQRWARSSRYFGRPDIKAKYDDLGLRIHATSPADFGKLIAEDTEKWAKVIKFAGIKPI